MRALLFIPILFITACGSSSEPGDAPPVVWPLSKSTTMDTLNDGYGPRELSGGYDFHRGLDMPAPTGTPIYAPLGGTVVRVEEALPGDSLERLGKFVIIAHDPHNGVDVHQMSFQHMNSFSVTLNQRVEKGQQIGTVGNSGVGINTEHLHMGYFIGNNDGLIKRLNSRNALRLLPYTHIDYGVSLTKSGSDLVLVLSQNPKSLDAVRIRLVPNDQTEVVLDFETREGMDVTDDDINPYGNILITPAPFDQNDTIFQNTITFQTLYAATT
ncbi:MAG: M23 family metallopeptidase, partial [Gammaproteobacteria bacterium]|nr:M23 family metallopeptidase [Gammaproteobacteria bacterium]